MADLVEVDLAEADFVVAVVALVVVKNSTFAQALDFAFYIVLLSGAQQTYQKIHPLIPYALHLVLSYCLCIIVEIGSLILVMVVSFQTHYIYDEFL